MLHVIAIIARYAKVITISLYRVRLEFRIYSLGKIRNGT